MWRGGFGSWFLGPELAVAGRTLLLARFAWRCRPGSASSSLAGEGAIVLGGVAAAAAGVG